MTQPTAPCRKKGGRERDTRKESSGCEREQGITWPSFIFGTSSNTEPGAGGAAALPWRNSSRQEAGDKHSQCVEQVFLQ